MLSESSVLDAEQVAAFFTKHRTGLVTLMFTDLVDSSGLLRKLGDQAGTTFMQRRRQLLRETLRIFPEGEEIETAGDSFLLVFTKPSEAVRFALRVQARLRVFSSESGLSVQERIGIHLGEVVIKENETPSKAKDLYGLQLTTCARVMSLAQGGQTLLTRGVFDSARQVLKGEDLPGVDPLSWMSHGPYVLKGIEEAVEVCEVGEAGQSPLAAPKTSGQAQRQVRADEEPVLGWRPAIGQLVPNTKWVLEQKLGEGGFGEVWLGRHQTMKERRVFKFCFRADRVRSLKREMTLFRLIKERIGDHPNIVSLREVYFDQPPYYVEEDYVEGQDLSNWCAAQGGADKVPLETKLEIIAQVADALQAAHDAGVIHRDVKPANILVSNPKSEIRGPGSELSQPSTLNPQPSAKLTDFGIGQVVSEEALKGVTRAGFTQTIVADSSSSHTGSQMYMAPELLAGRPASTRSDIYSLGVVLYQLLIGDLGQPLTGDWADTIPDVLLGDDLKHCLAGKPEERFVGAAQLARVLRSYADRQQEHQRRVEAERRARRKHRMLVIASGVAAVGVLVAIALGYGLNRAEGNLQTARARLYAAEISRAYRAIEENNLGTALDLLERHRPKPVERDLRGWEWRYLWQCCQSDELRTLGNHSNSVSGLRFCSGGRLLVSSSFDQTVKVWELETGKVLASLPHGGLVRAIDISPDGRWLATGTDAPPGPLRLWDTRTWQEVARLAPEIVVKSVAFSPDGQHLATVGQNKVVIWNISTHEAVISLAGGAGGLGSQEICFSPDGQMLAYQEKAYETSLALWDIKRGTNLISLPSKTWSIAAITFSPDGKYLVTGSWDKTARVWDVKARSPIVTLTNHTAWVSSLAFSPAGDILATASADQHIKLWNTTNWLEFASLKGHLHEIWAVAFSPDGRTLASGSKDETIRLWSSAARPQLSTVRTLPADAKWIVPSPNGTHWGTPYEDGAFGLWDSATLTEYARVPALFPGIKTTAWAVSPGGTFIAQGTEDRKAHLRDPRSGQQVAEFDLGDLTAGSLSFSTEGTRLAVTAESGRVIQLWDVTAKRRLITLTNELPPLTLSPVFSPDPRELGTAHADGIAAVWDLGTGRPKAVLRAHRTKTWAMAFSPDGRTIATTGDEGSLKLWDRRTKRLLVTLRGQLLTLHSVAFSGDGRRVGAGTGDGLIKIWDTETYQELATLRTGSRGVGALAFLPQGNTLASATYAKEICAWRAPSFAEIEAAAKARAATSLTPR